MCSTIGERLNELMKERGLTGEQVGQVIGISYPAVSQWRNEVSNISLKNLFKLAKLFDCSIDYLTGRAKYDVGYSEPISNLINRLQELLTKNKVSLYRLNKDGILSKSTYYAWLKGTAPRIANIIPLADYFKCTLDYILGC